MTTVAQSPDVEEDITSKLEFISLRVKNLESDLKQMINTFSRNDSEEYLRDIIKVRPDIKENLQQFKSFLQDLCRMDRYFDKFYPGFTEFKNSPKVTCDTIALQFRGLSLKVRYLTLDFMKIMHTLHDKQIIKHYLRDIDQFHRFYASLCDMDEYFDIFYPRLSRN